MAKTRCPPPKGIELFRAGEADQQQIATVFGQDFINARRRDHAAVRATEYLSEPSGSAERTWRDTKLSKTRYGVAVLLKLPAASGSQPYLCAASARAHAWR